MHVSSLLQLLSTNYPEEFSFWQKAECFSLSKSIKILQNRINYMGGYLPVQGNVMWGDICVHLEVIELETQGRSFLSLAQSFFLCGDWSGVCCTRTIGWPHLRSLWMTLKNSLIVASTTRTAVMPSIQIQQTKKWKRLWMMLMIMTVLFIVAWKMQKKLAMKLMKSYRQDRKKAIKESPQTQENLFSNIKLSRLQ